MKDIERKIQYGDKEYTLVFNLNVMEEIQEEYGSLDKWAELTDGSGEHEPNAKAIIFGFRAMLNEGIDIDNDRYGLSDNPLTLKQAGRIITKIGLENATNVLNQTVIDSTQSTEKNV